MPGAWQFERNVTVIPIIPSVPKRSHPKFSETNQFFPILDCADGAGMRAPHFEIRRGDEPIDSGRDVGGAAVAADGDDVGELLLRTGICVEALLAGPTADAGLNEARYQVLAAIHRQGYDGCSQTELAGHLLQSESNLSTLLERMRLDGLVVRERSATDRRRSVIRLTDAGAETLQEAARRRKAVLAKWLPQEASFAWQGALQRTLARMEALLSGDSARSEACSALEERSA